MSRVFRTRIILVCITKSYSDFYFYIKHLQTLRLNFVFQYLITDCIALVCAFSKFKSQKVKSQKVKGQKVKSQKVKSQKVRKSESQKKRVLMLVLKLSGILLSFFSCLWLNFTMAILSF